MASTYVVNSPTVSSLVISVMGMFSGVAFRVLVSSLGVTSFGLPLRGQGLSSKHPTRFPRSDVSPPLGMLLLDSAINMSNGWSADNGTWSDPVLQSTTPVLLQYYKVLQSTTKYYSSTTLYYKVLRQYYSILPRTTTYYSVLQSTTTYYSSTTKYYSSTILYYKVLLQYHSVLQSSTPVLLCTARRNKSHRPTSPNTAPATQNECHQWSASHMKAHFQCVEQVKSPSNLTKYCTCHAKWMSPVICDTYETSFPMRGASTVSIQPHQNAAPATQNQCHQRSAAHMKRHFQCAEQLKSPSNLTKYCACHEILKLKISSETPWSASANRKTIRP